MENYNSCLKPLDSLHYLINQSLQIIKDSAMSDENSELNGILRSLEGLNVKVQHARELAKQDRPLNIAVFGPPKMGKSTLLNVFLGADILPRDTRPTTRGVVKIEKSDQRPHLIIKYEDGSIDGPIYSDSDDYATYFHDEITELFKDSGADVKEITMTADFKNGQLLNNSRLFDTPGAESAFKEAEDNNDNKEDVQLKLDTQRALSILEMVDIPLFCLRLDYWDDNKIFSFYKNYMKSLKPIVVINQKDCWDPEENEGKTLQEQVSDIVRKYRLDRKSTVAVSAKKGLEACAESDPEQKMKKLETSGFTEFRQIVQERLESMLPQNVLLTVSLNLSLILNEICKFGKMELLPHVVHVEKFLADCTDAGRKDVVTNMTSQDWHRYRMTSRR